MTDRLRVYLPATIEAVAELERTGSWQPEAGGHAVTPALRAAWGDADEEELEYAALTAAGLDALELASAHDRRVVLAADLTGVEPVPGAEDPTAVSVAHPVARRRVAAVHVDDEAAAPAVARARATRGAPDHEEAVEECLEHELGWYATQEIGDLLDP